MSLSPDECKWSARLTLTQRGVRCGFTDTCVCVCVLEEVEVSTVWTAVETVVTPGFHQTPLPLELWPPPAAKHPTGRRADPGGAGECVCVCVSRFSNEPNPFFFFFRVCVFFPLDSTVLHLNFQLTKNTCTQQVVLLMSQAHLHPFDSTPCHLIATTAVRAEEPARFYHLAVQPHAFTGLHHEHPHMQAYTHSSSNEISPSPMLSVLKEHNRI